MTLDWNVDYTGPQSIKHAVNDYIKVWDGMKRYGIGLEFGGKSLGTGKTFAATHIGKELVKAKEYVYFIQFGDLDRALHARDQEVIDRVQNCRVLILDEVRAPYHDNVVSVFSGHFERIIRHRTNYNDVTIMTTNLLEEDLERIYPRTYSLLCAKQTRIEMTGEDHRKNASASRELEYAMNGEVRPIV